MSDSPETPWTDATPLMPVVDALEIACRVSGKPTSAVFSATYISATQLKQVALEDPSAHKAVQRFEPHWRIHFAGEEAAIDEGYGSGYTFSLGRDDDVLVFADGVAMTFSGFTNGA